MCGLAVSYDLSEFNRLARETAKAYAEVETGETLADYYVKCGDALQIAGVPRYQISSMVREKVEAELRVMYKDSELVWHSGHFYRVMDGHGWKNPIKQQNAYGSRNESADDSDSVNDNNDDDDNDNDSAPSRGAKDTSDSLNTFFLPLYKRLDEHGMVDFDQIPHAKVRWPYYQLYMQCRDLYDKILDEMDKDWDIESTETGKQVRRPRNWSKLFESEADALEYHKALADLLTSINETSAKAVDNRQSILPYMLFPFLAKLSITTIKHFASKHFALIRAMDDITTKKTTQFLKSVDAKSDILTSTMVDSWKWHYIDIRCPECKEYTLKPKNLDDGTWHFVCKNWKAHKVDELTFPAELFKLKINSLELNHGRAADNYLKNRWIADSGGSVQTK